MRCASSFAHLPLIDSPYPDKQQLILDSLHALGHGPGDLKRILLTHCHPDHAGWLAAHAAHTRPQFRPSELFTGMRWRALVCRRRLATLHPGALRFGHGGVLRDASSFMRKWNP